MPCPLPLPLPLATAASSVPGAAIKGSSSPGANCSARGSRGHWAPPQQPLRRHRAGATCQSAPRMVALDLPLNPLELELKC
eukprot:10341159-Alexandrium_andersonii.AAC.1